MLPAFIFHKLIKMKKIFFTALLYGCALLLHAQNPVHWSFSSVKLEGNVYEIHLSATIDAPWHTYSEWTPAGGPLPTKITFSPNPLMTAIGIIKEQGDLQHVYDKTFDVEVDYFSGKADFVKLVKLKGHAKTALAGTVEFMACNDKQCLPPSKINFSIALP
jgi:hypothetical protein